MACVYSAAGSLRRYVPGHTLTTVKTDCHLIPVHLSSPSAAFCPVHTLRPHLVSSASTGMENGDPGRSVEVPVVCGSGPCCEARQAGSMVRRKGMQNSEQGPHPSRPVTEEEELLETRTCNKEQWGRPTCPNGQGWEAAQEMLQGQPLPFSDAGVLELPFSQNPREALKHSLGALVLTQ